MKRIGLTIHSFACFLKSKFDVKSILPSLFTSLFISALFLTSKSFSVGKYTFDIIGSAVINDIDPGQRVTVLLTAIVLFILLFAFWVFIFSFLVRRNNTKYIDIVSGVGVVLLIFRLMCYTNYFEYGRDTYLDSYFFNSEVVVFFFIFLYFVTLTLIKEIDDKKIVYSLLVGISLSHCFQEYMYCAFEDYPFYMNSFAFGIMIYVVSIFVLGFSQIICDKTFYKLIIVPFVFSLANITNSLIVERVLLFNSNEVFISGVKNIIIGNYIFAFCVSIILIFTSIPGHLFSKKTGVFVFIVLLMVLFKAYQPNLENKFFGENYYELANGSTSVYGFLQYNKYPVLETYSAHMVGDVLFQIVYGFLSNDYVGAATSTFYNIYLNIVALIALYLFLRLFFDPLSSFIFVVFFPISISKDYTSWLIGLLPVVCLCYIFKRKSILSYVAYFTSLFVVLLYRLDVGSAFIIGTVPLFIYYFIKLIILDKKKAVTLLLTAFIYLAACVMCVLVVCKLHNIQLVSRIDEFLQLALSNNRWGYLQLGPRHEFIYLIFTYGLPIIVLICFFFYVIKGKKETSILVASIAMVIAVVFNFSRGLVRHSLVENEYCFAAGITFVLIPLLIVFTTKRRSMGIFPLITFSIVATFAISVSQDVNKIATPYSASIVVNEEKYEDYNEVVQRVEVTKKWEEYNDVMKTIFDGILEESETFIALGWHSPGLYSFVERECPVYENQICGILSNTKSQNYLISQWDSRDDVIVAITDYDCFHTDGICPQIQHRYVYKYLAKHYKPCFSYYDNVFWVLDGYHDRVVASVEKMEEKTKKYCSFDNFFKDNEINFAYASLMSADYVASITKSSLPLFNNDDPDLLSFSFDVDDSLIDKRNDSYFHLTINKPNILHSCNLSFNYVYSEKNFKTIVSFEVDEKNTDYYFYLDSTLMWNYTKLTSIVINGQPVNSVELVW